MNMIAAMAELPTASHPPCSLRAAAGWLWITPGPGCSSGMGKNININPAGVPSVPYTTSFTVLTLGSPLNLS